MLESSRIKPIWLFIFILFIGIVIGSIIGELLGDYVPILSKGPTLRLAPQTLSLGDMASLTFGFMLRLNTFTIVGIILAIAILRYL